MIKFYSVVLKESPLDSPFVPKDKCIGAAIATAAATVIGSAINAISQGSANSTNLEATSNTNRTNEQIANRTNEMSQAQFNSNMQWLREQYYTNRKYALEDRNYNEPSQVVQRLLNAGVNPSSFFGSGSTPVTGSSSVGAPSQSQFQTGYHQAGHVEPINIGDSLSESVQHAFDAYHYNQLVDAQRDKTKNESQIARANAFTQLAENVARIRNLWADTDEKLANKNLSDETREMLKKQREDLQNKIDLFMRTMDDQVESLQLANARQKREMSHIDFEENIAKSRLDIERALAASQIDMNSAQVSVLIQQVGLIAAQTQTEYERTGQIHSERLMIDLQRAIADVAEGDKKGARNLRKNSAFLRKTHSIAKYLQDIILGDLLKVGSTFYKGMF